MYSRVPNKRSTQTDSSVGGRYNIDTSIRTTMKAFIANYSTERRSIQRSGLSARVQDRPSVGMPSSRSSSGHGCRGWTHTVPAGEVAMTSTARGDRDTRRRLSRQSVSFATQITDLLIQFSGVVVRLKLVASYRILRRRSLSITAHRMVAAVFQYPTNDKKTISEQTPKV